MKLYIFFFLFLILLNLFVNGQECSPRSYCPPINTCADVTNAYENDGITLLDFHPELVSNVEKAINIIRKYPGVTSDDALIVHTSFMYLCCQYYNDTIDKAYPAMDSVSWLPFNVSYDAPICNHDGSIILMADAQSQIAMQAVVSKLEDALTAAGVFFIPRAEMEHYHITLATTNASFPMTEALTEINTAIPPGTWTSTPITLDSFAFFFPPKAIVAH